MNIQQKIEQEINQAFGRADSEHYTLFSIRAHYDYDAGEMY